MDETDFSLHDLRISRRFFSQKLYEKTSTISMTMKEGGDIIYDII